ncbi:MAG: helix-turn-helix transcriptional regulator [Cyclobacteriaceae bacterium]
MQEQDYLTTNMKWLRAHRQLNQKEVAAHIGVSTAAYNNYEQGKRQLPPEVLERLAGLYACNAYDLRHTDLSALPADTAGTVVPVRRHSELTDMDKDDLVAYNLAMQQEVLRIRQQLARCMQWIDNVEQTIGDIRKGTGSYGAAPGTSEE